MSSVFVARDGVILRSVLLLMSVSRWSSRGGQALWRERGVTEWASACGRCRSHYGSVYGVLVKAANWESSPPPKLKTNDPRLKSVMSGRYLLLAAVLFVPSSLFEPPHPKELFFSFFFFIVVLRVMNQKIIQGTETVTLSIISKFILCGH